MDILATHRAIVEDYAKYIRSFIGISDEHIRAAVEHELSEGRLWPEPLLQFNPAYESVGKVADMAAAGELSGQLADVFSGYSLYRHQLDAIRLGTAGRDFVVTSGTGSGKSLTYMASIFEHLLRNPDGDGVSAVVVYPMNALINSQTNEFTTYKENFERRTGREFPITFGQYTGQEKEDARALMRDKPPHVLLTNYMMLELLLTRTQERSIRDAIYRNLRFLTFDELHTYRGRQGADVAMLIRRIRAQCQQDVACIGTSATMVSGGNPSEQRAQVAEVASTIFGRRFEADQIIGETLVRSLEYRSELLEREALGRAIDVGVDPDESEDELRRHPLAVWLENRIAIEEREGVVLRRPPMTVAEIVGSLSEESGRDEDSCFRALSALLAWIGSVNERVTAGGSRYTILPFKLHQFVSQTGSVYTTLDPGPERHVTLEPGLYKHDEEDQKPIFPNVFSRATGHPFICVSLSDDRLEPREFRESADDESVTDGYLIVGEGVWDPETDLEYLPEAWVRDTKRGLVPDSKRASRLPKRIYFDSSGRFSETEPMEQWGWFMSMPLLFDPTGGVFYDERSKEGTKLSRLGSEGRSTSTTITTFSILSRLREAGYQLRDQRLISFTDNRQDAALQAGHFNDFIQVVRLRAGIHKALMDAPGNQLTYSTISEAVFTALNLPFVDYGNREGEPPIAVVRRAYDEAFKDLLTYRLLGDLRRSWRIVLPNLEQCGLLDVDYTDLDEVAGEREYWSDLPILRDLDSGERRDFLFTVLDFFRLEFAIHSENFLVPERLKENEKRFREKLKAPWTLDAGERLPEPAVLRLDPLHRSARLYSQSMGPTSTLGKYIKQFAQYKGYGRDLLRGDAYKDFVLTLMSKLCEVDYLFRRTARNKDNEEIPVYRLRIDKIVWRLGDGENVRSDAIKNRAYKKQSPRPNTFFRDMYRLDLSDAKRLRAEDHTGQLSTDIRREREERFRAEWYLDESRTVPDEARIRSESISALFCSPTMELGIDIGGLSVVHMRNAPPNPANYAQRSGRAGRGGQGALVFTYCSSYSPHDRHYFQNQRDLVAGTVQAPRIDLCNRELLLTHLNALAISAVGLPGIEAGVGSRPSLMRLVMEDDPEMGLQPSVRDGLALSTGMQSELRAAFRRTITDFVDALETKGSAWYSDEWIGLSLGRLSQHLDESLGRWRTLYQSARALLSRATQPIESGRLQVGSDEYKRCKRLQDQANRQLNLLRNETLGSGELSEFYPYRYLASEAFLPGYNFTRLPLRVFLPVGDSSGEYVSRARSIALREFGPLNVIYHNGRKFRVSQLVVQEAESSLTDAKVSTRAGYFLSGDQRDLEICPFSGANLGDSANREYIHDLLEMGESRAEEVERISCEEEERVSKGFEVRTFFSVDDFRGVVKATVRSSDAPLLNIRYMPAARLVHVNSQWRGQRTEGFPVGLTSGDWRGRMPEPDDNVREDFRLVKLWTSNIADALYIEPIEALGLEHDGVVTLEYALKRAIEAVFQVEPGEISVVAVGLPDAPNILLYEAAEGSLGVLSQFVESPATFSTVVAAAKEVCRYDDESYRAPASYDDLLSYHNQRDHKILNRFLIQDALEKLAIGEVEVQTNVGFRDYDEQYEWLRRNLDPNSSTERAFLKYLHDHGLRLPDDAQRRVEGVYCQPDFYYEPRFWVFCDGSPHDDEAVRERDTSQRQAIMARGDEVWSWHYQEDLAQKVAARPDVFRRVR